jgi:hypothetical protein
MHSLSIGKYQDTQSIDQIKIGIFKYYEEELKSRPSFHEYTDNLPEDLRNEILKISSSKQLRDEICKAYKNCNIKELPNINELYISHYNLDKGGDEGLFKKHYDGILGFLKNATFVRVLLYVNSNDKYVVHFLDSNVSHNFKTYEFGILDFNREYHQVEGKYDPNIDIKDTRIILKLNYMVCPVCSPFYSDFLIFINGLVFHIVKSCMEYSKSPKTIFQKVIGFFCNLFRIANNIHITMTILLILVLLFIVIIAFVYLTKFFPKVMITIKKTIKKTRMF